MAGRRPGDKSLSEPMVARLPMQLYVFGLNELNHRTQNLDLGLTRTVTRGCAPAWSLVTYSPPTEWLWPLPLGQCVVQRCFQDMISIEMTTLPCGAVTTRSNFSEILITDIPFVRPLGWDVGCLLWVQTLFYTPSQPLYLCLQYHAILVRVVAALVCISFALNRIIHVPRWTKGGDQSMWTFTFLLTFHLCSMPNLICEYYAASLLYRAKLFMIRSIIIFHICATLPSPELHLTEMVCFQCFICLHVFHILFTDFRLFVFMFDSRRFCELGSSPCIFRDFVPW